MHIYIIYCLEIINLFKCMLLKCVFVDNRHMCPVIPENRRMGDEVKLLEKVSDRFQHISLVMPKNFSLTTVSNLLK